MKIARPDNGTGPWTITVYDGTEHEKKFRVPAKLAGWAAGMMVETKQNRDSLFYLSELRSNEREESPFMHICNEIIRLNSDDDRDVVLV